MKKYREIYTKASSRFLRGSWSLISQHSWKRKAFEHWYSISKHQMLIDAITTIARVKLSLCKR